MKNRLTLSAFLCLSLFVKAQVQFAGMGSISNYAVNSTGNYAPLHTYVDTFSAFSSIVQAADDKLYCAADYRVYTMNTDGTGYTLVATLPYYIKSKLSLAQDGKLYLTTYGDKLYSLNTDGTNLTYLASVPSCIQMVIDSDNWIYGVSTSQPNILYRIKTDGTGYQVLHTFDAATEGTANYPGGAGICLTTNNRIFGTMVNGGSANAGTVYSIKKDGLNFQVHYQLGSNAINGGVPVTDAPVYQNGKLFFITTADGANGAGTICSIDSQGNNLTKLHDFGDISRPAIGTIQRSGLMAGNDGKLYGCTYDNPTLYSITEDGLTVAIIHSPNPTNIFNFWRLESAPFLLNNNSTVLFQSLQNGLNSNGFLMSVETDGQNAHSIYSFGYAEGGKVSGFYQNKGLVKDASLNLYGVTYAGGIGGGGTIFKQSVNGSGYTILHNFIGTGARNPNGKLLLASDGKLYGVCKYGGNAANMYRGGVIYKMNTDGNSFTIIKQFNNNGNDYSPIGQLTEGPGGELYGITESTIFGNYDQPVIYKINKDGTGYTILKSLNPNLEGRLPKEGLLLSGSYLYATFAEGGIFSNGTIVRIQTNGTGFQVLKNLTYSNSEGVTPLCGLTAASNGRMYGVNSFGGVNGGGTLFSMLPNGTNFIVHKAFDFNITGYINFGRLLQASNGKIYGTNLLAGVNGGGSCYGINTDGTGFTILRNFNFNEGYNYSELLEVPFLATLPVTLTDFTAQKQQAKVLLSWGTEQETNSDKFIIERSADGMHFNGIKSIPAKGYSYLKTNYTAEDLQPIIGKNYYRLKMTDKDGHFEYSNIRIVDFTKSGNYISLYPNPAKEIIIIEHKLTGKNIIVTVADAAGKIVIKQNFYTTPLITVNINTLRPGMYILTAGDGKEIFNEKIIKE